MTPNLEVAEKPPVLNWVLLPVTTVTQYPLTPSRTQNPCPTPHRDVVPKSQSPTYDEVSQSYSHYKCPGN